MGRASPIKARFIWMNLIKIHFEHSVEKKYGKAKGEDLFIYYLLLWFAGIRRFYQFLNQCADTHTLRWGRVERLQKLGLKREDGRERRKSESKSASGVYSRSEVCRPLCPIYRIGWTAAASLCQSSRLQANGKRTMNIEDVVKCFKWIH